MKGRCESEEMMKSVVGLDLSLRGTGIVVLGAGWHSVRVEDSPQSDELYSIRVGYQLPKERSGRVYIERINYIAGRILEVIKQFEVDAVGIEDYAYSAKFGRVFDLAELGGVVKHQMFLSLHKVPQIYTASTVRKHLMGRVQRATKKTKAQRIKVSSQKEQVSNFLKKIGLIFDSDDESDAFAIAVKTYDTENNLSPKFLEWWDMEDRATYLSLQKKNRQVNFLDGG